MLKWPQPLPLEDECAWLLREVHKTVLGPSTQEKSGSLEVQAVCPTALVDDFYMIYPSLN
jgi:hypothetical protein